MLLPRMVAPVPISSAQGETFIYGGNRVVEMWIVAALTANWIILPDLSASKTGKNEVNDAAFSQRSRRFDQGMHDQDKFLPARLASLLLLLDRLVSLGIFSVWMCDHGSFQNDIKWDLWWCVLFPARALRIGGPEPPGLVQWLPPLPLQMSSLRFIIATSKH